MGNLSKETVRRSLFEGVRTVAPFLDDACTTHDSTFLKEEYFHHLLTVERKRTERSGNTSLLMLVDVRSLAKGESPHELACKISMLLSSVLRESDVIGWYASYATMGVILSEIGDTPAVEATGMILAKFKKILAVAFGPDMAESIRIDFEYITQKKRWKEGNSLVKLRSADQETFRGEENGFLGLLKSLLRGRAFLVVVDLLLVILAQCAGLLYAGISLTNVLQAHAYAYLIPALICCLFFLIFDLYNPERFFKPNEVAPRIVLSVIAASGLSAVAYYLAPSWGYARGMFTIQAGVAMSLLIGWRMIYRRIFQFSKTRRPTLIIGAGEMGKSALKLLNAPHSPFEVAGFLDDDPEKMGPGDNGGPPVLGATNSMFDIMAEKGIKTVVVAMEGNGSGRLTRSILEARLCGREVYDLPSLYEKLATRIPVEYVQDRWLVFADGFELISREHVQRLKRIFDFSFSTLLLLISLPVAILTALAIRLDSPGPVFFKQMRIGKGEKPFMLYKFRSMCRNAENQGAKWAEQNDPRVTRVGRIIRTLRIDELPQVWNVFLGDMSLIGPRPERPEFVEDLDKKVPYYSLRHTVRPGITGWAQIKYPYGATVEDALRKLEYDLFYIKNMSFLQDLKILLQTIGVVILGKGAR